MQPNENLINDALEYYDKNNDKYDSFFKNVKYVHFEMANTDVEHNRIIMMDKDRRIIINSRYENIGIYNNNSHTWIWAWSVPIFKKNSTQIAKKIINYGMNIDLLTDSNFLKTELITSRFRISNPIQLDIHVAIASYLSKQPLIYKYVTYSSFMEPNDIDVDITNIKEKDKNNYITYFMFLLDYDYFDDKLKTV